MIVIRRLSVIISCAFLSLVAMGCMSGLVSQSGSTSPEGVGAAAVSFDPNLVGEMTGPDSATFGSSFDAMLIVTNNGRGTAYNVTAAVNAAGGVSSGVTSINLGTIKRFERKSVTIRVTAGSGTDPVTAGIGAKISYTNKPSGPRSWYYTFVQNHPVLLSAYEGAVVTIELRTSLDPVHAGVASVYDIYGNLLMTKTTETAAHLAFSLPPGTYSFSAGGRSTTEEIVSGQKKNVVIGDRDTLVRIWLCPSLTWAECDLRNNPPVWGR